MRRVIVFVAVCLTALSGWAQVRMTVEAPRVVTVGTQFRLVFSVNETASNFVLPPLDAFHVLTAPAQSSSRSDRIVNGVHTSSVSTNFTLVVEAKQEGKITIGSGSVTVDGKKIQNDPITIEAIKGEVPPQGSNPNEGARASTGVSDQDIYLRLELNKTNVVKGESITALLKLYTKVPIESYNDVRFPTFNGFWSQEIETHNDVRFTEENVGGQIYQVAPLRRYILIPQQTGSIRIEPAEMVCSVRIRGGNQGRSMFDLFFDNYQSIRKRIATSPITVNVQPLPAGAPPSFTGAVGKFSLSAKMEKDSINAHDATSLIVRITGQGNINMVVAPKPSFPADLEEYDTRTVDNTRSGGSAISGTKQFEYPVIPRNAGTYTIDPVEFSYWDIDQKRYVALQSDPLTLKVGRGREFSTASGQHEAGVNQMAVRTLGHDIRYIRTALPVFVPIGNLFMGSVTFWSILFALLVSFFVAYRLLLRKRERNKNVVLVRSRKANKQARKRLKRAEELLKEDSYAGFYEEVHHALWGYVGNKLGIPPADYAKEHVCALLLERRAPEEWVSEFSNLIEECEYARYAPAPEAGEMDKIFGRALQLISNLEQTIK